MGLFDRFKKKKEDKEELGDFTKDMINASNSFIEKIGNGKNLDFTVESLKSVDKLLEEASDYYPDMDGNQKQNLISAAGSYIFETLRKNFSGKFFWYDHLNQSILVTGQPEFEVSILANT